MSNAALPRVSLAKGHVQPVWAGHPWVFAQAVANVSGEPRAGDEVLVCDALGEPMGRGLYSPGSAIAVRIFGRSPDEAIDEGLFERRIRRALARRAALGLPSAETTGLRLVHAEGDALPGLIVDRLGDVLAVQWGTIGLWQRREAVLDVLERELRPRAIVDRTSARSAEHEGFAGQAPGARRDADVTVFEFDERGLHFRIPRSLGQKTGFYFDQRPLRARVEELSAGRRVLDAYCYVGSIALSAARGGASEVLAVDTSAPALAVAEELCAAHGVGDRVRCVRSDASAQLRAARGSFDLVICDPPKLAPARAARGKALTAMRRIARGAAEACCDGGLVVLSSCSAALGAPELARALALGARDAGAEAVVLERWFQGPDHPVPAAFPEGLYLSSIIAELTRARENPPS